MIETITSLILRRGGANRLLDQLGSRLGFVAVSKNCRKLCIFGAIRSTRLNFWLRAHPLKKSEATPCDCRLHRLRNIRCRRHRWNIILFRSLFQNLLRRLLCRQARLLSFQLLSRVKKLYANLFSFDHSFTVSLILEFAAVFLLGEKKSQLSLLSRVKIQLFGKGVLIKDCLGQGGRVFNSQLWR